MQRLIAPLLALVLTGAVRPLPAEQWDDRARLTLARALVGEAGWRVTTDHRAIPWVLARRWRAVGARHGWSFAELVERYCAPLRPWLPLTPRRALVRELAWERVPARVREVVVAWGDGRVADPCPGADHWDSHASAEARGVRMPRVACDGARNAYFASR